MKEKDLRARIYQPARTAMQSGNARAKAWTLEYEPASPRRIDPLMGWTSSADMLSQVQLEFDTKEEAIRYAEKHGIAFDLFEPHRPTPKPKAYADNFRYDRKVPWSH
jgi:ETC complex I subunit conserved region